MVPFNLVLVVTSLVVINIHVFMRRRSCLFCFSKDQGSKKVPSGRSGKVDFCVRQVAFPTHLPDGQGYGQAARELS